MSGRAKSGNWEVELGGGRILYPIKLGDFAPGGVEGRLEVTDGRRRYKVLDQVPVFDEVEMDIEITDDKRDFDTCEEYAASHRALDVFVRNRDGAGKVTQSFMFASCQLGRDKMNGGDPKSKVQDMRKYYLLPQSIEEIT